MEPVVDQAAAVAPPLAEGEGTAEADALTEKAQSLMVRITSSQHNPNPRVLHALASLLETEESRYVQEFGHSSFNNTRASHNIGLLGSLIRENEEFLDLVSSKFLSDSRFNTSIRAAASRLLLACSAAWMYPQVLEDDVLENIKHWVMDGTIQSTSEGCNSKSETDTSKPSDIEMLRTYATGLLTVSLSGGGQLVEDVLMSGLSSKLMQFLRIKVLGETSTSQKDTSFPTEGKHASASARGREESRSRFRQVTDTARLDAAKASDEALLDDQITEKEHDRTSMPKQIHGKECREDGLPISARDMPIDESDDDEQVGAHKKDFYEEKAKLSERTSLGSLGRSMRDEEMDENTRDESSRYRTGRAGTRNRGKERAGEVIAETERSLTSPGAGTRIASQVRAAKDRYQTKTIDPKRAVDIKKDPSKASADALVPEKEDDDSNIEVKVGTVDVSDLVKKAKRAAEAEARAANAPPDAVKAVGDAAMELVKTAASEAFNNTNNEEAVVDAAAKAASTVVEAAIATEVSRSQMNFDQETLQSSSLAPEKEEEIEGFFIPDREFLAQLRERYCIQCLQLLGEYVEVLGPVLHEKGVDVCLTLLQRNNNATEPSTNLMVLSDVLKLVCALAAHRKFAALFVDRGGMQRLLAVRRVSQTFVGLSSCLFAIGSLQGIMERFCALPSDVVHQVVELALQLLECSQDQARKNAALFFGAAFVFRAVLDSFDTQDGLPKLLNLLRGAASVRSGVNSGSLGLSNLRNDRAPTEVLSASEKQIAYHTCVALRQYFRSHLLLLVDSLRPNKNHRSGARNISSARAAYKPLDISNEAMDAIFLLLQRDRKIGPAFVRVRWPPVDKFLSLNGHTTLLELCQAPPVDRYLHDLAQYALGVLHIVTLVPYSRRAIISSTLSNERVGMAVILDAANGAGYGDPEVIQPSLNLLVNLCCPPPSLSNKLPQGPHASVQNPSGLPGSDHKERHTERSLSDRSISFVHTDSRERAGEQSNNERGGPLHSTTPAATGSQSSAPLASGVVGDRRISLGSGTGSAGLAAFMEQGYRQAWEAVRANNGIKVLLHLLHPRILIPPASLDCIRALACRVLLGLARDDSIAHILTKLQVGKLLSELIRDSGSQSSATEQGRWQAELGQVAMELIAIVTNAGRASALAATDAAAPTLRRIERAAIAAATPITYHARELLLLIHEHLVASGMNATADSLLKEAQLAPLPSLSSSFPLLHQTSIQDNPKVELHWPSRASGRFLSDSSKVASRNEDPGHKRDSSTMASRRKPVFSSNLTCQSKGQLPCQTLGNKVCSASKNPSMFVRVAEAIHTSSPRPASDMETPSRTPLGLSMKRKLVDRDLGLAPLTKRLATSDLVFHSPTACKTPISVADNFDDIQGQATPTLLALTSNGQQSQHGFIPDTPSHPERVTLDSLVVQYLKHQHRQCPAPITTLPPLSLLHPHVCPEPSRRLDMPVNVVARLSTRESRIRYGGIHGHRRDRQFVFSRFRPWRTCRDEAALLTCISFLGDASRIVTGSHAGELKIFDVNSSNVLESHLCHQTPVMLVQSSSRICRTWSDSSASARELLISSSAFDVRLWDSSSLSAGPIHVFEGRKAARFNHAGNIFATVASELSRREVFLYDVETFHLDQKLSDTCASAGPIRSHVQSIIHFSPSDEMVLWNGILWDRRVSRPIHRFDQFTDYGGGGFHPAGNEVIINSEVWDLKKFKLLRSVPSLDQTVINFNAGGDIIYAMLRRNLEDITSAVHTRRVRHPLFAAFRTVDAVNYSDIATIPVDRCVLDFATEPSDSFVGVVAMDDHEEMFSSARLYEVGRRRSTDDDSDPDDGVETDEEDDDEDDSEADEDPLVAAGLDADVDSDGIDLSNDDDDDTGDELDDADFNSDDEGDFDSGAAILELVSEDEGDDNQMLESLSSEDEGEMGGFHDFHDLGF